MTNVEAEVIHVQVGDLFLWAGAAALLDEGNLGGGSFGNLMGTDAVVNWSTTDTLEGTGSVGARIREGFANADGEGAVVVGGADEVDVMTKSTVDQGVADRFIRKERISV